jgi:hypothetical protein
MRIVTIDITNGLYCPGENPKLRRNNKFPPLAFPPEMHYFCRNFNEN